MDATVLERVRNGIEQRRERLAEWLRGAPASQRARALGPMQESALHSYLAQLDSALQKSDSGALGLCEVCHEPVDAELLEMDYESCVCLEHLSEAQMRELERELELAQGVQRELLPQQVPDIPGLQIAAYSRPAQIVSGDFFDFYRFQDGRPGVVVADVAGHGLSASLHMASLQSLMRALVPSSHSPGEVLQHIHRLYRHNFRFTTFVSVFLLAVDLDRGEFSYVNAGHNPPALAHAASSEDAPLEWLMPTGPALGLTEQADYGERHARFVAGDMLTLYTDGIPEAFSPSGNQFGQDRLEQLLLQAFSSSAPDAVRTVRDALQAFIGGDAPSDDVTLIVLKGG